MASGVDNGSSLLFVIPDLLVFLRDSCDRAGDDLPWPLIAGGVRLANRLLLLDEIVADVVDLRWGTFGVLCFGLDTTRTEGRLSKLRLRRLLDRGSFSEDEG